MRNVGLPLRHLLLQLWRNCDGSSAVELAFVIPVVAFLAVGAFDFGRALQERSELQSAARSGAEHARITIFNSEFIDDETHDTAINDAIEDEVETLIKDTLDDQTLTVTARVYCTCPSTGTNDEKNCWVGCGVTRNIEIDVLESLDLVFDYPGLPGSLDLEGHIEMRIE